MSGISIARSKMEEALAKGITSATALIEAIERDVPKDSVVRDHALHFSATHGMDGAHSLRVRRRDGNGAEGTFFKIHRHALQQMSEVAGIPINYVDRLLEGDKKVEPKKGQVLNDWKLDLLEHNFNEAVKHSTERHLFRSVRQEVRGFLSDKYRRLDSRPLIDAFIEEARAADARPYNARNLAVRQEIQVIQPQIIEPIKGEFGAMGAAFSNSDFGAGSLSIKVFFVRLICLNGMTAQEAMRQIHLGKRLDDSAEFSQQTYELDTRATVSALRDIVRNVFSNATRQVTIDRIRKAGEESTAWPAIAARISKNLTKAELEAAKNAFEGPDTINLPPLHTKWRASNALSWIANTDGVTEERRIHLEKLAGEIALS